MLNLKVYFMIRDGYAVSQILKDCKITKRQLAGARKRYEKDMNLILPRARYDDDNTKV